MKYKIAVALALVTILLTASVMINSAPPTEQIAEAVDAVKEHNNKIVFAPATEIINEILGPIV